MVGRCSFVHRCVAQPVVCNVVGTEVAFDSAANHTTTGRWFAGVAEGFNQGAALQGPGTFAFGSHGVHVNHMLYICIYIYALCCGG